MDARVELEGSNKDKFQELQEFLEERTNNEKYGKANTLRLSVQLGHQKMEELKQDRKEKVEEFKEYERKIEKAVEEL